MSEAQAMGESEQAGATRGVGQGRPAGEPWYRRGRGWGQTNVREIDALPEKYDVAWWKEHWRRTRVQGVIVNAGGIVAYYPSALELHRRSPYLGERDLFGELARAAHELGLVVLARMDSSRADQRFYDAHPDWFTVDAEGQPRRAGTFDGRPYYTACISGPYYHEYLPGVLREICERYRPEGFGDNSWAGLSRAAICYCPNCARSFAGFSGGRALPREKDWEDPAYRAWIEWSYAQRARIWELNNETARRYGGPDCLWLGMNSGSLAGQCATFRDWRAIADRSPMVLLDHQGRHGTNALWQNGETGKLIRAIFGDDVPIPESIAMYNNTGTGGAPSFRVAAKPEPEVRLWFAEAVAGGIRPWWHHIGAWHEDRRQFRTAEPLFAWHEQHERYLRDRQHLASVGVVFSQRSVDFYGRDDAAERCEAPLRGTGHALIRARIPYAMVPADRVDQILGPARYGVLVLPNVGALSDAQVEGLRRYVAQGGSLLATGETSLYDEWGDRRPDFALGDLFGARYAGDTLAKGRGERGEEAHTYLRIVARPVPIRAANPGGAPAFTGGWDETEILPFGGSLVRTEPRGDPRVEVPLTYIPPFPIYPPEFAYMRTERTDLPALYLRHASTSRQSPTLHSGRVAYLPADVDRIAWHYGQADHLDLLAALVRWLAGGLEQVSPIRVRGAGLVDVHAYTQGGTVPSGEGAGARQQLATVATAERVIVHLVNLTHAGTWKGPIDELNVVGEQRVAVHLPPGRRVTGARLLVAGHEARLEHGDDGEAAAIVPSIADHEVVVLEMSDE